MIPRHIQGMTWVLVVLADTATILKKTSLIMTAYNINKCDIYYNGLYTQQYTK
jgi:hypothetical protein